jgi:hypothetical protein
MFVNRRMRDRTGLIDLGTDNLLTRRRVELSAERSNSSQRMRRRGIIEDDDNVEGEEEG